MMLPVFYTEGFTPFEYFKNKERAICNWLSTKYKLWEYEQEIRLIMADVIFDETRWGERKWKTFKIMPELVEKIYLGSRINLRDEEIILDLN